MTIANRCDHTELNVTLHAGLAEPGCYQILVQGCLDGSWSEWFDGLAVVADRGLGQTAITGWLADQAALHGLLNKVRNLGLVLLAVNRLEPSADAADAQEVAH